MKQMEAAAPRQGRWKSKEPALRVYGVRPILIVFIKNISSSSNIDDLSSFIAVLQIELMNAELWEWER